MPISISEWSSVQLRMGADALRLQSPPGQTPVAVQQITPGSSAVLSANTSVIVVASDAPVLVGVDGPTAATYLDPFERRVFAVKPGGSLVTQAVPIGAVTPAAAAAPATTAPAATASASASAAQAPAT